MTEPLLRLLDNLPPATLDASRADRVRTRCHDVLARRRLRRVSGPARHARFWTPIVACFCGVYLTEVLHQALAIYGLR